MVWSKIARFILKYRVLLIIVLIGVTGFMAWQIRDLQMDYGYSGMLPDSDSVSIEYEQFKQLFGEDGTLFFLGIQDPDFFSLEKYREFERLKDWILQVHGINSVLSVYDVIGLKKNSKKKSFEFYPLFPDSIKSQQKLDSLVTVFRSLPIYKDLVYNDSTHLYVMVVSMDEQFINTSGRVKIIKSIVTHVNQMGEQMHLDVHYSGLPYVRTEYARKIKRELFIFLFLATMITGFILLLLFKSWRVVMLSLATVAVGVTWTLGIMAMLDYRLTVLSSMIPPVLIVIGIPNGVFLINRYHQECRRYQNKIKALHRAIQKVGTPIFMTNLTTAAGFATFMVIKNMILFTFGQIASIGIILMFGISITLIPILLSFLSIPASQQVRHLDNRYITRVVEYFVFLVTRRRKWIFIGVIVLVVFAAFGMTKMHSTGYIVDDLPKNDPLYLDLKFFEKQVNGVMPMEIAIDTRKPNGVFQHPFIVKVDEFQQFLAGIPDLSKSFSFVDGLKFARQAYFNGEERQFKLPSRTEQAFILRYFGLQMKHNPAIRFFIDSTNRVARINVRVADVGINRMLLLQDTIQQHLRKVFPENRYHTILTGSSLKFTLGTKYLVENLFVSLGLAILLIALFMAWMFKSFRMVLITLFANFLPLIFTAGLMGYVGISIKPSTVLVFSVTFGIAVDTAIHYLAKYRQELAVPNTSQPEAVIMALQDVGVSIIYTVCILFMGFGIFMLSKFGGTVAMGFLVSITLLVAVVTNLLLVPSLLLRKNHPPVR
ncbi:MAG: MMPL family transporter [Bacteroidales bacterium]|nr:MMPL family transporter [Bacteroidales bacterium]